MGDKSITSWANLIGTLVLPERQYVEGYFPLFIYIKYNFISFNRAKRLSYCLIV